ncbi:MAG: bifunctional shikimate kinase/3-dehydroquinate synthase [Candidatus Dormibacteria bacterium]
MSGIGHIVLVGLPGTGKSSVAPLLAARLGRGWVDTDAAVESHLGMSVAQAFTDLGEARFRAEERRAAELALATGEPLVIAAGGGLVGQPGALEVLERRATVVCLDAADSGLAARLAPDGQGRPLLGGSPEAALRHLRAARGVAHARAQLHVHTDLRTPAEVAERIAGAVSGAVRVATAHPYLVRVGAGTLDAIGDHVPATARRAVLIADLAVSGVAEQLALALRRRDVATSVVAIPGGEQAKRWSVAGALLERCSDAGLERDDCIVAVGGGSIGDVTGLVAATYLRGIAWVVVPTTLLAMVDSAVGGKTAVNLRRGKNLAGAFWQPRAVLCDPAVLEQLGDRSFRSAFAEIVKSSMVGGVHLTGLVERCLSAGLARDSDAICALVRGCCELKADVVAGDEREAGRRAILNYGHTVGHAVEELTGAGAGLDHGEAVAFGMRVAGALSIVESGCPPGDIAGQDQLLDACGLTRRPELGATDIAARLGLDKKARGGVARWVLLRRRGEPVTGIVIGPGAVRQALAEAIAA